MFCSNLSFVQYVEVALTFQTQTCSNNGWNKNATICHLDTFRLLFCIYFSQYALSLQLLAVYTKIGLFWTFTQLIVIWFNTIW